MVFIRGSKTRKSVRYANMPTLLLLTTCLVAINCCLTTPDLSISVASISLLFELYSIVSRKKTKLIPISCTVANSCSLR